MHRNAEWADTATVPLPPAPHIPQGVAQVVRPSNRLSKPTVYPKFATWLGSYEPNTIMKKMETLFSGGETVNRDPVGDI